MHLHDLKYRPLRSLRLSVTDRCNLRCRYCMPEQNYRWLPRPSILRFEEMIEVVKIGQRFGVEKVRITGGEPLLRGELEKFVAQLNGLEQPLKSVALTTNGLLLPQQAQRLWNAGLRNLTVSLDSLRPQTFELMSQREGLHQVLEGLAKSRDLGFEGIKLDTVVVRGQNDQQLLELLDFARENHHEIRFIEYMDVGGATGWSPELVVPKSEMLAIIQAAHRPAECLAGRGSAPAERYRLSDGTVFGIIASTSEPFCGRCDRARLTADGHWLTCLYAKQGLPLRDILRSSGAMAVEQAIKSSWQRRSDQGAIDRLSAPSRSSYVSLEELRQNPQLEMHTRGG